MQKEGSGNRVRSVNILSENRVARGLSCQFPSMYLSRVINNLLEYLLSSLRRSEFLFEVDFIGPPENLVYGEGEMSPQVS